MRSFRGNAAIPINEDSAVIKESRPDSGFRSAVTTESQAFTLVLCSKLFPMGNIFSALQDSRHEFDIMDSK